MKYVKNDPRIRVKVIDGDTEEILVEINDRSWMTLGEIFSDGAITSLIEYELRNRKNKPKNLMVLAVAEFKMID
jgi:thioester reductase-like protein